jgi:GntR family transcriptional regulator / MocR family aminotransferase
VAKDRTNSPAGPELLVELDRHLPVALHRQLEQGIRERIRFGRLAAGAVLPSTRALAADLGLSRGVVVEAYQQLVAEGYLVSRTGGHTQVATGAVDDLPAVPLTPPTQPTQPIEPTQLTRPTPLGGTSDRPALRIDFRYGRPDVSQFPRAAWLRSTRRVLTEAGADRLLYLEGRGTRELREALAGYLNRVRGTVARPDNIVITSGFGQGIRLLAQVLAALGTRTLAVEDPSSDDDIRIIAPTLGLDVVGVPVGTDGISVRALERSAADAVLVTAAHQFPTGAVLPAGSRKALVEWVIRRGGLIVEDDYDAEFRYDRDPIGAIQGLAPDHVVYAGTTSKTLAPGLRLGWLVLPDRLVTDVAAAKLLDDRGSPVLEQLVFADFVAHGEFDRHLRRMRPRYRHRRDVLVAALGRRLPELRPMGISAGMHVTTWLPADLDEAAVVAAAARSGLGVYGVRPYRLSGAGPAGLVFGYGNLSEPAITEGIDLLAAAIAGLRGSAAGDGGRKTAGRRGSRTARPGS